LIKISGLTKSYPSAARPALDGVSLQVPPGCVFGLLGPNGAGKTTLISILTGMLGKDVGRVEVGGINVDDDLAEVRRLIGYVPQDLAFYPTLTVGENLRLFSALSPGAAKNRLDFAIHAADLSARLKKPAQALSGGLKRRLNLAIGLLGQPRLLCLDEPTAGVDPQSRHFLIETVKRLRDQGMTILYTTHYMEEIERACEQIAILDHGRIIAEGPLKDLLARGQGNLESLFLQLTDTTLRDA
jgi:ABC-2 type transport system ATP-binding protein